MTERTDPILPQAVDAVDAGLSTQNYLKRNVLERKHFENVKENKNDHSDIEQHNITSIAEEFEEDYNANITFNSISSDGESESDIYKLQPECLSDNRRFFQNLPDNINPCTSTFSAQESRLRIPLESGQFKQRITAGSSKTQPILDEARRQTDSQNDSMQDVNKLRSGISSQPSRTSPKSFQCSPLQGFNSKRRGSRSSLDSSFDEDSSAAFIPRIKEGLYFCHLCSFSGSTQEEFDVHMTVHFEHICPHCDYKSRTEGRLKIHIKDFHTDNPDGGYGARTMPGRPKVFRCKQCEYSTIDKLEFWSHSRSHIKEDKLLQCPQCTFVTEYKHHLEYHLRNHFGSKPFKCPKCNYTCVNKSMLNSHMKSHTNVYQYRCADCIYATKYCHSLKLHLRKYNHNPAAVLNSDGSLPQGINETVSGLTLHAKRGPPRGPRDPRKYKIDTRSSSFRPFPLHPIGPLSLLQGMSPPFWPMLHSNFSGSSPGTLGLGHRFNTHFPRISVMPQVNSEDIKPPTSGIPSLNPNKCNFCNFIGINWEVLISHVMQVHAIENRVLFSMFGLSTESLHMLKSSTQFSRMETLTGNSSECFVGIKKKFTDEGGKIMVNKKEDVAAKETTQMPPETVLNGMLQTDSQFQADFNKADEGSDTLHQMTLTFRSGPMGFKPKMSPTSFSNSVTTSNITTADGPLDLTKPRHYSLSSFQATSAVNNNKNEECEEHSSGENSVYSNEVTPQPPRKRSRKGKAFKLDTLFMKLKEAKKDDIYNSDDDSDVDIERMYTSNLLPIEVDKNSADNQAKFKEPSYVEEKSSYKIKSSKITEIGEIIEQTEKIVDEKDEGNDSSYKIGNVDEFSMEEVNSSPILLNENDATDKTDLTKTKGLKNTSNGDVFNLTSNEDKSNNKDVSQELAKQNHSDSIPAAIQRGADIAWKMLNDPKIRNPSDVVRNGSNGHKWELSPFNKKVWKEALSCINAQQKLERGNYKCPHCQISFGDCVMYTIHMGYHGYKEPYKCNMCGDTCRDRVEFFLHIARTAHN